VTTARQVADLSVADRGLRSLWLELGIRDIEEQGVSQLDGNEALKSICSARPLFDLEPPVTQSGP